MEIRDIELSEVPISRVDSDHSYEEEGGIHFDVVGTRSSDAFWT